MDAYWEQLKAVLFHDFKQAWIFVAILFVTATTLLRWLLTSRIKKSSKRISSKNLKPIQNQYLYKSISGWFFYLLSLGLFVLYWYAHFFQVYGLQDIAFFFAVGSGVLFLLSIITHLSFFAAACLDQIKLLEDKQLTP
jgi:hypothetical protein